MAKKKVLIVDDEEAIVLALSHILLAHNYEVHSACDGNEGLRLVKEIRPDLVLLDVMMPFIDGFKFSSIVRADENLNELKIIFITAKGEVGDRREGYSKGGDDYIVKPFSTEDLLARVEFALNE